jgi:outer membrane protein OmpA-like peptidoglycan-associated protein
VAREKGGIVSVASTKEYSSQMPNTIIGIDKWMKSNRPIVEGMLKAITDGGDLVSTNSEALDFAAEVSAKVYGEEDAEYWKKYYKGVTEADKTGMQVELGGSSVNNLAENLMLFGMVEGGANLFEATYTVFGDIVKDQYPELVPNYPPVASILDTSYLAGVRKKAAPAQVAEAVKQVKPKATTARAVPATSKQVISTRKWRLPFQSGRAEFSPAASKQLQQLRRDLLVASGTTVEVHGHTDSQGNPQANMELSEARAFAVKKWLEKQSPVNFPAGRVRVFAHGQTNPVAQNSTEAGRAQNRRVEIVLATGG